MRNGSAPTKAHVASLAPKQGDIPTPKSDIPTPTPKDEEIAQDLEPQLEGPTLFTQEDLPEIPPIIGAPDPEPEPEESSQGEQEEAPKSLDEISQGAARAGEVLMDLCEITGNLLDAVKSVHAGQEVTFKEVMKLCAETKLMQKEGRDAGRQLLELITNVDTLRKESTEAGEKFTEVISKVADAIVSFDRRLSSIESALNGKKGKKKEKKGKKKEQAYRFFDPIGAPIPELADKILSEPLDTQPKRVSHINELNLTKGVLDRMFASGVEHLCRVEDNRGRYADLFAAPSNALYSNDVWLHSGQTDNWYHANLRDNYPYGTQGAYLATLLRTRQRHCGRK